MALTNLLCLLALMCPVHLDTDFEESVVWTGFLMMPLARFLAPEWSPSLKSCVSMVICLSMETSCKVEGVEMFTVLIQYWGVLYEFCQP